MKNDSKYLWYQVCDHRLAKMTKKKREREREKKDSQCLQYQQYQVCDLRLKSQGKELVSGRIVTPRQPHRDTSERKDESDDSQYLQATVCLKPIENERKK